MAKETVTRKARFEVSNEIVGNESLGIRVIYANGKKIFISKTTLMLIAEIKELEAGTNNSKLIDVLVDLKFELKGE